MTLFSTYLKLSYRLGITKHTVNELKNWHKHYVDTTLLYYYHENEDENFKECWHFCNNFDFSAIWIQQSWWKPSQK